VLADRHHLTMKNRQIKIKRRAKVRLLFFYIEIITNNTTNFPGNRLKLTEYIDKFHITTYYLINKTFIYKTSAWKIIKGLMRMKSSPRYRFFRVISGGDLVDIDIFQYPHKTTVVISMLYYKQEHILMVSKTSNDRRTAIKLANFSFLQSKTLYEKKLKTPPVLS
jgi:hypothetical protein